MMATNPGKLTTMLIPRLPIDSDDMTKLDALAAAIRSQVEEGETDPFDNAMLAATFGIVDTMKANSSALADIAKTLRKLARTG